MTATASKSCCSTCATTGRLSCDKNARRSGATPPPASDREIPDFGVLAFAVVALDDDARQVTTWYTSRNAAEDGLVDLLHAGHFGRTVAAVIEPWAVTDDQRATNGALVVDPELLAPAVDVTWSARDRAEGLARAQHEREIRTQAVRRVEDYLGSVEQIVAFLCEAVGLEPVPTQWVPLGWMTENAGVDTWGAFDPSTAQILIGLEVALFEDDPWTTTAGVLLHEVAHGLATLDENDPDRGLDHGPAFDRAAHELAQALGAPLRGRADPQWPFGSVVGAELLRHLVDRLAKAQEERS